MAPLPLSLHHAKQGTRASIRGFVVGENGKAGHDTGEKRRGMRKPATLDGSRLGYLAKGRAGPLPVRLSRHAGGSRHPVPQAQESVVRDPGFRRGDEEDRGDEEGWR